MVLTFIEVHASVQFIVWVIYIREPNGFSLLIRYLTEITLAGKPKAWCNIASAITFSQSQYN